jgi:hypothetical protein
MKKLLLITALFWAAQIQAQSLQWARSISGSGTENVGCITTDAFGNVYTTGGFTGVVDFDPGPGTFTINGTGGFYIQKLDVSGNFVWAKWINGSNVGANGIAVDPSGNVYTTGQLTSSADFDPSPASVILSSAGNNDVFILKLNSSGDYVWAKNFGNASAFEYGSGIALDVAGDLYIIGSYNGSNSDFDPSAATNSLSTNGGYDAFVAKYTSAGNYVWAKTLGSGIADYGRGIKVDATNNVYVTGYYQQTADFDPGAGTYTITAVGQNDAFVTKLDVSGNFVWAKSMGGAGIEFAYGIDLDPFGNVLTTGFIQGNGDYDPGPGTYSIGIGNVSYISKLDNAGNFVWARGMQVGVSGGQGIATDGSGNVFTIGSFNSTFDFDPGAGVFNLTNIGGTDIYINQIDASGNFVTAINIGDVGADVATSINISNNSIHVAGTFAGTVDFDFSSNTFNMTSVGTTDVYNLKLSSLVTGLLENLNFENSISIYPNPSNGLITIKSESASEAIIEVFNTLYEIVHQEKTSDGNTKLNLQHLPNGIYTIRVLEKEKTNYTRAIIQK